MIKDDMVFDKEAIKRSFSMAASTYDEFAGFQKDVADEVGRRLFSLLQKREHAFAAAAMPESDCLSTFLDIGCGTGKLAALISSLVPDVRAYASDIASTMIEKARENHGNSIALAAADFSSLPFRDSVFDSAASSLAFQWAEDLELAFSEAARVLKPGGLLVFSTLGPSTLWELSECYKGYQGLEFKDRDFIEAALKSAGLETVFIEVRVVKRRYNGFIELLKALKNIGAAPTMECGKGLSPGKALKEAGRLYAERFPSPQGGIEASYELIIAAARKV